MEAVGILDDKIYKVLGELVEMFDHSTIDGDNSLVCFYDIVYCMETRRLVLVFVSTIYINYDLWFIDFNF